MVNVTYHPPGKEILVAIWGNFCNIPNRVKHVLSCLIMPKKKDIWSQVSKHLQSKLPKSQFSTWFSRAALEKLDSDVAIISVPNKFVANWLADNYLTEIKKSFKSASNRSPSIHFSYNHASPVEAFRDIGFGESPRLHQRHRLNPSMTFQHFVSGSYNRFAFTSAVQVAEKAVSHYNPFYIYSSPGLGKTHLLHAIGNHWVNIDPYAKVRYLSSDTFSSDFIYAIKNDKVNELRIEYCNLDLLLFDDIQFLVNREKTQEEFLFIFDSLYATEKQIVITGNNPPHKFKKLNPQLKSRLGAGLLAGIDLPDQGTKIEIVKKRAGEDNLSIPEDVVFFLANSSRDVKGLIKNVVKLETYSSLNTGDINISLVKAFVSEKHKNKIDLEDIKATTAAYFNISVIDLMSYKKKRVFSYPRQLAMYLARRHTSLSFKDIGVHFSHRDHSTVVHAIKRIEGSKGRNEKILNDIKKIENLLG
jgi:chromosomal replication initiator protein